MTTSTTDLAEGAADADPAVRLALFRMMVEMRQFEKRAYDLFMQSLVKGTSHLSLGQEAIAAGFGVAMRPDDWTFATYRGHAHTLARGASMTGVMGELLGRGQGWLDAPDRCRQRRHGQLRHHRRPPTDRLRCRLVGAIPRHRSGRGVFLWGRDDEYWRLPRVAELCRDLETSGRLR